MGTVLTPSGAVGTNEHTEAGDTDPVHAQSADGEADLRCFCVRRYGSGRPLRHADLSSRRSSRSQPSASGSSTQIAVDTPSRAHPSPLIS